MGATRNAAANLRAQLAFTGRKFHAWWEGYAFDADAERAALQAYFATTVDDPRNGDEVIAEAIWGKGRLEPGEPAWTMRFARLLSLPVRANVVVFGAGAGGPLDDLKHGTRWKTIGFTRTKSYTDKRLRQYEDALQRLQKGAAGGALSFFELHRDANPEAVAALCAEMVTPGAKVAFVDFAGARRGVRLRSCFPATPKGAIRTEQQYEELFREAGFTLADKTDESAAYLALIEKGWAGWRRAYRAIAAMDDAHKRAEYANALARNAHLWAERYDALKSEQLKVVCFRVFCK
ncbi:MAG: hypothetical protein HKN14_16520 [Marinicaulis sp.]|nr:hypothetical protein [Marinicaulis sp.]